MNKLTSEKCREQFEAWFADHAGQTVAWVKSQRASDTHYKIGPEIQRYWLTWQASRQGLEIALPILEQQERPIEQVKCPFPCGWKELLRVAMNDGAFLSQKLIEGEEVRDIHRHAALSNTDRLVRVITAILDASEVVGHQERACQKCGGTGMADSGGTQPWGEQILVECDCQFEQQERGEDGWIEWGGDGIPVDDNVFVEVKWRNGAVLEDIADAFAWYHDGFENDIIAYRIIPEQPTN